MSLLIKGVEMPDSCLNCRFRTTILKNVLSPTGRTSVYACLINGMEINNWYEEKHKDCPLVEVPTPHSRLIDADKLVWFIDNHIASGKKWVEFETIKDMINSLPTIIEAEVSE